MSEVDDDRKDKFVSGWLAKGTLLADGLCVGEEYSNYVVPLKGDTIVFSTIAEPKIREISLSDGKMSVDFQLTIRWLDPNIKNKFSLQDDKAGFVALSKASLDRIWTPDLYILDSVSFKPPDEWASLKSASVLTKHIPGMAKERENEVAFELRYDIKSIVYCRFYPAAYPMDRQMCNMTLGSSSFEDIFVLYGLDETSHTPVILESSNLEIELRYFDNKIRDGKNTIGLNLKMRRIISPYLLKYYIPCIGIVFLTCLSFAIPVTADTGRGGFLVTLFLTLISLFISQMVSERAILFNLFYQM